MTSPEEIQRQIDATRSDLSANVDALNDKVNPARIVDRRVSRVKDTASNVRERVMGAVPGVHSGGGSGGSGGTGSSGPGLGDRLSDTTSSVTDTVGSGAANVREAASNAPQALQRQAQGNPLAAGLIAFGVGWLASSLLPSSQKEQQLGAQVKDHAGDLAQPLKEKGQELAQNLQEPAQQAVQQVKAAATDAASTTADHAKSAAADVKDEAGSAAGDVKSTTQQQVSNS